MQPTDTVLERITRGPHQGLLIGYQAGEQPGYGYEIRDATGLCAAAGGFDDPAEALQELQTALEARPFDSADDVEHDDWTPADRAALARLHRRVGRAVQDEVPAEIVHWIVEKTLFQIVLCLRTHRRVRIPELGELAVTHAPDGTPRAVILREHESFLRRLHDADAIAPPPPPAETLLAVPAATSAAKLSAALSTVKLTVSSQRGPDGILHATKTQEPNQ